MRKKEEWARHIAAQAKSGKSISEYCREQGVSDKAFGYYRRKLKDGDTDCKATSFVQLTGREEHFEISFGEDVALKIPVSYGLMRVMEALGVSGE